MALEDDHPQEALSLSHRDASLQQEGSNLICALIRFNRLDGLKLCRQHDEARTGINGQAPNPHRPR